VSGKATPATTAACLVIELNERCAGRGRVAIKKQAGRKVPFLPPRGKENGDQEAKVISGHLKTQRLSRATQQAGQGLAPGWLRCRCMMHPTLSHLCRYRVAKTKPYRLGGKLCTDTCWFLVHLILYLDYCIFVVTPSDNTHAMRCRKLTSGWSLTVKVVCVSLHII
jgi:hypothetical protein